MSESRPPIERTEPATNRPEAKDFREAKFQAFKCPHCVRIFSGSAHPQGGVDAVTGARRQALESHRKSRPSDCGFEPDELDWKTEGPVFPVS